MCGRINVTDNPILQMLFEHLGIKLTIETNEDLRPSQTITTLANFDGELSQLNTVWGIKPSWAKKLLINAQAETVAEKPTFKKSFAERRCLVPCSGWYEWRSEGGPRKQKYFFQYRDDIPMLMAGIWFNTDSGAQLVTLTTKANDQCAAIHDRMPVLVMPEDIDYWFGSKPQELQAMLNPIDSDRLDITKESSN